MLSHSNFQLLQMTMILTLKVKWNQSMLQVQNTPEGQIVVRPDSDDEITVNGTVLKLTSALAVLRAGCQFYNLSTSGSKQKCSAVG